MCGMLTNTHSFLLLCAAQRKSLESFLTPLLAYTPEERPTASAALAHSWLLQAADGKAGEGTSKP